MKTLPILVKPFVSGGCFTFQKPGSLRWEYDRPVRSVLLMHAGTVKRYLREGEAWREDAGAALTAMQTVMEEILNWQSDGAQKMRGLLSDRQVLPMSWRSGAI